MDFKVLCVGDVVGNPGMDRICRSLRYLKRKLNADFVIVNGENAARCKGGINNRFYRTDFAYSVGVMPNFSLNWREK